MLRGALIPSWNPRASEPCAGLDENYGADGWAMTPSGMREGPRVRGLTAGASRIRTCMGLFLSSRVFGLLSVFCSGAGKPFFVPSPAIRFAERAEACRSAPPAGEIGSLPTLRWREMDANFGFRARSINRSIGQCSTRSAGHGRVGLGAAGPMLSMTLSTSGQPMVVR
jgi:hypothetical protein